MNEYYSFLKSKLNIDESEIKYIADLTFKNIETYNNIVFTNLLMNKYLENYELLKDKINIKKLNFDELITKLNKIKNKAHYYFENINNNLPYYIPIIDYLENTSNIFL